MSIFHVEYWVTRASETFLLLKYNTFMCNKYFPRQSPWQVENFEFNRTLSFMPLLMFIVMCGRTPRIEFITATLALASWPNTFILLTHCVINVDIQIKYSPFLWQTDGVVLLLLGNMRTGTVVHSVWNYYFAALLFIILIWYLWSLSFFN